MDVYIDKIKGKVFYNDKTTGKVKEAKINKKPLKDKKPNSVDKYAIIAKLQALNDFLESKVSGLSVKDYDDYNALKGS